MLGRLLGDPADLLGYGDPCEEPLAAVFRDVAAIEIREDGIVFHPGSVAAERIREDTGYGGIRGDADRPAGELTRFWAFEGGVIPTGRDRS